MNRRDFIFKSSVGAGLFRIGLLIPQTKKIELICNDWMFDIDYFYPNKSNKNHFVYQPLNSKLTIEEIFKNQEYIYPISDYYQCIIKHKNIPDGTYYSKNGKKHYIVGPIEHHYGFDRNKLKVTFSIKA